MLTHTQINIMVKKKKLGHTKLSIKFTANVTTFLRTNVNGVLKCMFIKL